MDILEEKKHNIVFVQIVALHKELWIFRKPFLTLKCNSKLVVVEIACSTKNGDRHFSKLFNLEETKDIIHSRIYPAHEVYYF
jgi:hypothetical protein